MLCTRFPVHLLHILTRRTNCTASLSFMMCFWLLSYLGFSAYNYRRKHQVASSFFVSCRVVLCECKKEENCLAFSQFDTWTGAEVLMKSNFNKTPIEWNSIHEITCINVLCNNDIQSMKARPWLLEIPSPLLFIFWLALPDCKVKHQALLLYEIP